MSSPQFADEQADGRWQRQRSRFTERISADGSTGLPAEPGRYHLYVSLACPWAHRQVIVRELKGLTTVLPMTIVDPWRDEQGWRFPAAVDPTLPEHRPDPVRGARLLRESYLATDPGFTGRVTVPCLWDTVGSRMVSNDFRVLDIQLATAFDAVADHPEVDLYPTRLRGDIDALDDVLYAEVNDGVYRAGFATTQAAYDEAVRTLFARLDALEEQLAGQRYLLGDTLTLADIRLFTTLVRFDVVYHTHFRCNRTALTGFPSLWAYARDLFQTPGFGSTTRFDHIATHYYATHDTLNPSRIVPIGPRTDWLAPHGREALDGRAR